MMETSLDNFVFAPVSSGSICHDMFIVLSGFQIAETVIEDTP